MTAVRFENVRFSYPSGVEALHGVSFEVPTGQRLAIVGQNGAGKTTLVRHLNGIFQPTSGSVHRFVLERLSNRIEKRERCGLFDVLGHHASCRSAPGHRRKIDAQSGGHAVRVRGDEAPPRLSGHHSCAVSGLRRGR